mgnify:CR=1 FL=1
MAPMTVIEITGAGGPEVLQVKQRPIPIPRQGEVLIKLAYAGTVSYTHLRAHET